MSRYKFLRLFAGAVAGSAATLKGDTKSDDPSSAIEDSRDLASSAAIGLVAAGLQNFIQRERTLDQLVLETILERTFSTVGEYCKYLVAYPPQHQPSR